MRPEGYQGKGDSESLWEETAGFSCLLLLIELGARCQSRDGDSGEGHQEFASV